MAATRKKVIIRDLKGGLHRGYLPISDLHVGGELELLLPDGRAILLPSVEIRHVAYVRDFNLDDAFDPERIGARSFRSKPRGSGLWVLLEFGPGDTIEGIVRADLGLLDGLLREGGIFLEPPDRTGNTQRLFVPRSALRDFEVLGVAANAPSAMRRAVMSKRENQGDLFSVRTDD